MKIVHFDEGYHLDDPNIRWADPAYILEPGDPGYVPNPNETPALTQKRKRNTMPKSDYIHQNEDAFSAQLKTFKTNIGGYATTLGVTPAQVAGQAADSDYFAYVLACQATMRNGSQQWTAWKDLVRGGGT